MAGVTAFALLMEMGTAKSRTVLEDWASLTRQGLTSDLLVIAPAGSYRVWDQEEIPKWLPADVKARVYVWKSKSTKRARDELARMVARPADGPRILIVNVEALSTVKAAIALCLAFVASGRAYGVVDESTCIRNFKAARTKSVIDIGEHLAFRRIASGLPTPKSPLDAFAQFWFLDPRILGFKSFYAFKARYAVTKRIMVQGTDTRPPWLRRNDKAPPGMRPVDLVVGYKNQEELRAKIAGHSFRVLKDECLDIPAKTYLPPRQVELTEDQARHYKTLREAAYAELSDGGWINTELAVTTVMKLQQLTCGFLRDEFGVDHDIKNNRLDALIEVLDEEAGKAIIFAPFRHSLRTISTELRKIAGPESVVEYWGDTSPADRVTAVKRFQDDPSCLYFVGNPATAGKGLTLTAAKLVAYYANSWDLEQRLQSEDRPHRAGLDHKVAYLDFISPGTIDVGIVKSLRDKIDLAASITGDAFKEWLI